MSVAVQPFIGLPQGPVRRFTVSEYHRLMETGVIREDEPVELVEGFIVPKMPTSPMHFGTIKRLDRLLLAVLPAGWITRYQAPITTGDSEPEPDLAVVRDDGDDYCRRHPGPADIGLLIEVASTSLTFDRGQKARMYARAGITEYWVVDIDGRTVEVLSDPDPAAAEPFFRASRVYSAADRVPLSLGGRPIMEIPVSDILS